MGLDSVELVLRIEDEFSISLPDDEVSNVKTVGDLYDLVLRKLDVTPSCLSSKAFYRTRQAITDCLAVPRRSVRPSTDLGELLPEKSRNALWDQISGRTSLQFPRLRLPKRWRNRFLALSIAAAAMIVISIWIASRNWFDSSHEFASFLAAFVLCAVLAGLFSQIVIRFTPHLANELPVTTVGELARTVLTLNHDEFAPPAPEDTTLSKEYVWTRIVGIFCDQLQVEPEEVVPTASIAQDLGVD